VILYTAGGEFAYETHAVGETYATQALLTAFKYVNGRCPPKWFGWILQTLSDRPVIVDSGMFSLQGQVIPADGPTAPGYAPLTSQYMRWYVDKYIALLKAVQFNGLVVECDCHFLTRAWKEDLAWARGRMQDAFGDRVIYVWHPSTGEAWEDVLGAHKRVAISDPAMRVIHGNNDTGIRRAVTSTAIRSDQHVHILGSHNADLVQLDNRFTCDASTWSMIVRFGRAFPRTAFPVTWYRRKELVAPANVLARVDEKFDACCRLAQASPINTMRKLNPDYLRALAAALVAGNMVFDSESSRHNHPSGADQWRTAKGGTSQPETTLAQGKRARTNNRPLERPNPEPVSKSSTRATPSKRRRRKG